jgi:biotin carboxyl carrier protein
MKKLRITVEGKVYDVQVELLDEGTTAAPAPRSAAPAPAVASPPPVAPPSPAAAAPRAAAGSGDVPSPLAGKVVSIDVKVGDTVENGAQVATIEAMKMNTYIYAPKAGKVVEIVARPGEAVEEGAALLRLG